MAVLKLSIQVLVQKNAPPKAAAFWSSIKQGIPKNVQFIEIRTLFFK
jgi:hypothetical protein